MKNKHKIAHMIAAHAYARCSTAKRAQVGCVIVKDDRIISIGYNGMPTGWDNCCENIVSLPHWADDVNDIPEEDRKLYVEYKSKPEVLHAEANAIGKLASSSESGKDSIAFVTMAPCLDCAKLLYQSGITKVYYNKIYRNTNGLDFLNKCNIPTEQLDVEQQNLSL